jgi:hypothetical protein
LDPNRSSSPKSGARRQDLVGDRVEEGLAIEAGFENWLAIARHAGRDPQTRAGNFATDLALTEDIEAEEKLLVNAAPSWSAAAFFETHTAGGRDYTKGSEHYVVRYRAGGETRVLKATIPGKYGRFEYTPTIYLKSLTLLNKFVPSLEIRLHGIRVAADAKPSLVTSMHYIKGSHPHPKEIEKYLFPLGWENFHDNSETLDFRHPTLRQIIRDAHPRNWVREKGTGGLVPIDISIEEF